MRIFRIKQRSFSGYSMRTSLLSCKNKLPEVYATSMLSRRYIIFIPLSRLPLLIKLISHGINKHLWKTFLCTFSILYYIYFIYIFTIYIIYVNWIKLISFDFLSSTILLNSLSNNKKIHTYMHIYIYLASTFLCLKWSVLTHGNFILAVLCICLLRSHKGNLLNYEMGLDVTRQFETQILLSAESLWLSNFSSQTGMKLPFCTCKVIKTCRRNSLSSTD